MTPELIDAPRRTDLSTADKWLTTGENSTQTLSAISGIMAQVEFLALHMSTDKLRALIGKYPDEDKALTS